MYVLFVSIFAAVFQHVYCGYSTMQLLYQIKKWCVLTGLAAGVLRVLCWSLEAWGVVIKANGEMF